MYSPTRHVASNTMSQRKKENARIKALENKMSRMQVPKNKKPTKKPTPFGDAGSIVGNSLGGMFGNANLGKGIGRWLGTGIGSIFGSGDYMMTGASPSYNCLTNGSQIPKFDTTRATNVVCHREYLGDVMGTGGFNNTQYPLNPGMSQTFPWLSTIASNYQEYKIHGIIFEFRPLITDFVTSGAPGVVILATNYNADLTNYTTKQQMENSEFAVSVKPTQPVIHGIECADSQTTISHRYVRTGNVPAGQDLRLYDLGNFQFATQSNPVQNLGELWVSYCVEFYKPVLGPDVSGPVIQTIHQQRTSTSNANPLGLVNVSTVGTLTNYTQVGSTVTWVADPGTVYFVQVAWLGTSVSFTPPGTSGIGVSFQVDYYGGLSTGIVPNTGATTTSAQLSYILKSTLLVPGTIGFSLNASGSIPPGSVDIYVTQIDGTSY